MLLVGCCQTPVPIRVPFCPAYLQPHMSLLVLPFLIQVDSELTDLTVII